MKEAVEDTLKKLEGAPGAYIPVVPLDSFYTAMIGRVGGLSDEEADAVIEAYAVTARP
jgi:hypothetical protein